jgi:fatty acid desaturase
MGRTATILSLGIGLTAFFLLLMFGFAIWVFLPLLPAGIVFVLAVFLARKKVTKPERSAESDTNWRKAA